jgi:hypothetical protein
MTEPIARDLLATAGAAFTGVVSQAGATAVSDVVPDDRTVIVEIEEVLKAPPAIGLVPGARVTVQLSPDLPTLPPGERAVFFATGWVYADAVAVKEIGRLPADSVIEPAISAGGPAEMASRPRAEVLRDDLAQTEVLAHARAAAAVVRGKVVALSEVPGPVPPREHAPRLWVAVLAVDVVEKGEIPAAAGELAKVSVSYPNSQDIRWRDALKPKANQAGLWLLHPPEPGWEEAAPFCVLHRIDLQPSIQLDFLRERGLS